MQTLDVRAGKRKCFSLLWSYRMAPVGRTFLDIRKPEKSESHTHTHVCANTNIESCRSVYLTDKHFHPNAVDSSEGVRLRRELSFSPRGLMERLALMTPTQTSRHKPTGGHVGPVKHTQKKMSDWFIIKGDVYMNSCRSRKLTVASVLCAVYNVRLYFFFHLLWI